MSVFFSLITKRTTVPSLCRFNICASGGSRPGGKVGARSQTFCFCPFTVVFWWLRSKNKRGWGLPLIRHCVQRNIPCLGNKFSKQFSFEHILLKSSQKLVEHNGHFAQAMSIWTLFSLNCMGNLMFSLLQLIDNL